MVAKKNETPVKETDVNSVLPQDIRAEMDLGGTAPVVDTNEVDTTISDVNTKEFVSLNCSHAVIKIGNIYYPSRDGKISIPKAFEAEAKKILGA